MPLLADGTLIPCFGLTGIHSGSDATSLIGSDGVVEERNGKIGIRMSFKKRSVRTFAPALWCPHVVVSALARLQFGVRTFASTLWRVHFGCQHVGVRALSASSVAASDSSCHACG
jgi:hypothetical protein